MSLLCVGDADLLVSRHVRLCARSSRERLWYKCCCSSQSSCPLLLMVHSPKADCFVTRPVDCVFLRSTLDTHSEMIHHVIDRTKKSGASEHPMYPASKLHAEAMQLYLDKDFKQAAAKFENVSAMILEITGEEDRASQLMSSRCESYISRPPPAKWQGVWDRGEDKH